MPNIHEWWPKLSIEAKHALKETEGEPIPPIVRDEVRRVTGEALAAGATLSAEEIQFIDTQREQVD